jgi:hypothetical protein
VAHGSIADFSNLYKNDDRSRSAVLFFYFFAALTFAHLALFAALIRASPAGEMRGLTDLIGTTFWPLLFAHRAF